MYKVVAALVLLIIPIVALGHHSRSEFGDQAVEVEGKLTSIVWKNPHVALFLDVETENGDIQNWRIEGSTNPITLQRSGVEEGLFEVGQRLTAVGAQSKYRDALLVTNVLLDNGVEVIMTASGTPHWNGDYVGGKPNVPENVVVSSNDLGFYRAWHPARSPMMSLRKFSYTQQALAARSEFDPIDNPIVRCEQPGMPFPLFHNQPIMFTQKGENIELRHGYFDTYRTIYMDENLDENEQESSHLGFSKGHWENEKTLVIMTSRINYPYFDFDGTSQSEAIEVTERYSISEDGTGMNFQVTIVDPATLTEPAIASWQYLALDQAYSVYECNVF